MGPDEHATDRVLTDLRSIGAEDRARRARPSAPAHRRRFLRLSAKPAPCRGGPWCGTVASVRSQPRSDPPGGRSLTVDGAQRITMTETETPSPSTTIEPDDPSAAEPATPSGSPATVDLLTAPPQPGPANPSPDGATLAFLQPNDSGEVELWLSPTDGSAPRTLALDPPVALALDADGPQWSPDGTMLAVVGDHEHGDGPTIWLISVADGRVRPLREQSHPARDHSPRWSPDGLRLAIITRWNRRDALAVLPVETGPRLMLTDGRHDVRDPAWAPDGSRLAFVERVADDAHPSGYREEVCSVDITSGEIKRLTTKVGAGRRSPQWAHHRALIAFVSEEREWAHIAVVNPDNGSSWTMASEPGDKADPRWSPSGKLIYTRTEGGSVRCCVRNTNAARAELLDPGGGVAASPRWLVTTGAAPAAEPAAGENGATAEPLMAGEDGATGEAPAAEPVTEERAVYAFGGPDRAVSFVIQAPSDEAERLELPPVAPWTGPSSLATPRSLDFTSDSGLKLHGLLYRRSETSGPVPGVILVDDLPFGHRSMLVRPDEQTLAASGFAVFAPHLSGAAGLGRKVGDGLRNERDAEIEAADLANAAAALRGVDDVMADRLAVVGRGYGGTLALLLAGGRPGLVQAAVAIDPIVDWGTELEWAPSAWRDWVIDRLGLPTAGRARYAVRTPATFAAPIDVPLLLIATEAAPSWRREQFASFVAVLDELGVEHEVERVVGDHPGASMRPAAVFLSRVFRGSPAAADGIAPTAESGDTPAASGQPAPVGEPAGAE